MTLKEMIESPAGQYEEVKAAYWAGVDRGRSEVYAKAQGIINEHMPSRLKGIKRSMMERVLHDRACASSAAEILSWDFEMTGK